MGGLGGEHRRVLTLLYVGRHGIVALIKGMEGGVGEPCLVEVDVVHMGAQLLHYPVHVVAQAVIGGVGHHRHLNPGLLSLNERRVRYLLPHRRRFHFLHVHRTDGAVGVPGGFHVHGYGSGVYHGVVDALVAVPVHQHNIALSHPGPPDYLVGHGVPPGYEEGFVRLENPGRLPLAVAHHSAVVKQRAQIGNGNGEVGPEQVLTEELVAGNPHRVPKEGQPSHVPRCMPGVAVLLGVPHQSVEERGHYALYVLGEFPVYPSGYERGGVLVQPDVAVYLLEHVGGNVRDR